MTIPRSAPFPSSKSFIHFPSPKLWMSILLFEPACRKAPSSFMDLRGPRCARPA